MHLRPDRLRAHAAAAAELAGALEALDRAPAVADSIDTVVLRARRGLVEVEAALRSAACGADTADRTAVAALQRIADRR